MSRSAMLPLYRTPVEVARPLRPIRLEDRNVFLGSCFAEHVGRCFSDARFHALVNPLGVIYNPLSIARLMDTRKSDPVADYVEHDGLWHTWLGDTTLSRPMREDCCRATDEALSQLQESLSAADNLFLTLGTSRCYIYKERGSVVANCHRVPQRAFQEVDPTLDEMAEALDGALSRLHARNPNLQVVLTVSPYRYQKYGFHESQLSKARLLLLAERLQSWHPDWVTYFPAYEILLDELRDYRFYADDMLHPSAQAVDYVWSRLCDCWMADDAKAYLRRWQPIARSLRHKPLQPEAPASAAFEASLRRQLQELQQAYPTLNIEH